MLATTRRRHGHERSRRPALCLSLLLIATAPLLSACDPVEPVLVGSILISSVDRELIVGNTVQLTATVQSTTGSVIPGHPVTWSSSADSVATVTAGGLVTAVTPGPVTIRASSGGATGSRNVTVAAGPCAEATEGAIAPGETRSGRVDRTDCTIEYARADGWSLQLASATGIQIVMLTDDFHPGLLLTDRQLNPILWGNGYPGGVQLLGEVPAGQYIVWAASFDESQTGEYQLSAAEVEFCADASATTAIAAGAEESGSLGSSDCFFLHGVHADGFRLNVPEGTGLRIDLTSAAFDALLVVTDEDLNVLWWDDDGGTPPDARLERRFPAGEYLVWATGFEAAVGAYNLTVTAVEIALCPTVGSLEPDSAASGTISTEDCLGERGYSDPWHLSVVSETTLQIDLTSAHFDAFLIVENEHGDLLAWNDDNGTSLDSRLEYTFPAGEYRVIATTFGYGETGSYELTAQVVGAGAAAWTEAPARSRLPWAKAAGKDRFRD